MGPLPNVPHVVRVDFFFFVNTSNNALSRQFYHYSGSSPSASDIAGFVGNVYTSAAANFVGVMGEDNAFAGCRAVDLNSAMGQEFEQTGTTFGTESGGRLPADTSFVAGYEIVRRYRGGHPRGYFPFGVQADLDDESHWTSGALGSFMSALSTLQSDIISGVWSSGGTLKQVNVSYFEGFDVITSPTTGRARNVPKKRGAPIVDDVVNTIGRARVGTQRRRIGR